MSICRSGTSVGFKMQIQTENKLCETQTGKDTDSLGGAEPWGLSFRKQSKLLCSTEALTTMTCWDATNARTAAQAHLGQPASQHQLPDLGTGAQVTHPQLACRGRGTGYMYVSSVAGGSAP